MGGRDRPLVELARQDLDPLTWRAALLWHATRDEFLLRDFLLNWLYPRFEDGTLELRFRRPIPAEDWNAQLSLLAGRAVLVLFVILLYSDQSRQLLSRLLDRKGAHHGAAR